MLYPIAKDIYKSGDVPDPSTPKLLKLKKNHATY